MATLQEEVKRALIGGPKTSNDLFPLCHLAGSENQFRLALRRMRLDGDIVGELLPRGGSKGGVARMYRLRKGGEPIDAGDDAGMQAAPLVMPLEALRARSEEEVDEIELERIEAAAMMSVREAKKQTQIPSDVSVEALERLAREHEYDEREAARPSNGSAYMQGQPENTVSESVEEENYVKPTTYTEKVPIVTPREYEDAMKRNEKEAIAEPIKLELPPFRVGVFNDGKMMLMRDVVGNASVAFAISKEELAELVAFARTVGWLE